MQLLTVLVRVLISRILTFWLTLEGEEGCSIIVFSNPYSRPTDSSEA
jgi:hypothetical protein